MKNALLHSLFAAAFAVLAQPVLADSTVLSNAAAGTEGNQALIDGVATSLAYQAQFDVSELSALSVGDTITGFSLRLNGDVATAPSATATFANFNVIMAEAANENLSSSTFADNMMNPVTVRTGSLVVPANSLTGGSSPNPFALSVAFDTGYEYKGGDLVLYFTHNTRDAGGDLSIDAAVAGLGVGSTVFGRLGLGFMSATSALPVFLPLSLEFTPVPEPSEYALAAGLALVGFAAWRKRARRLAQPSL